MRGHWIVLLAACHAHAQPAVVDAAPTFGSVQVTVYGQGPFDGGVPLANTDVYFVEPAGDWIRVDTDATGVATALVHAGTTVIVVRQAADQDSLSEYTDVSPGATIISGNPELPYAPGPSLGTITFALPAMTGVTYYAVHVSCQTDLDPQDSEGRTWILTVSQCPYHSAATAIAIAEDIGSHPPRGSPLPLGYSVMQNLDLASLVGTTVNMPAYQPPGALTGQFDNLLPGTTMFGWDIEYDTAMDDALEYEALVGPIAVTGGSLSRSEPVVPVGDRSTFTINLTTASGPAVYHEIDPQLTTDLHLDASTMVHVASETNYDTTSQTFSWKDIGAGVSANVVYGALSWTSSTGLPVLFEIVTPPQDGTATIQPFPAPIAQLASSDPATVTWTFETYGFVGKTYDQVLNEAYLTDAFQLVGPPFWQE